MPGHKGGRGISRAFKRNLFKIDTTELDYSDNLYDPTSVLKRLQDDIASLYGCYKSFILVNGATSGIISSIYACAKKDQKVIIAGSCHISVINALKISGANAVFVKSQDRDAMTAAVSGHPDAGVLFITRPDYYGRCPDVKDAVLLAKGKGIKTIVDEAHGTHFFFSDRYPVSAISLGADIVIQSPHKTLPVLTQGGLLLLSDPSLEAEIISALRMFSTTSPSYILIVSIENGFGYMARHGKIESERLFGFARGIDGFNYIKRLENNDPSRIVLDVSKTGYSGYAFSKILRERFGIYAELADESCVVFISTVMNIKRDFDKLKKALTRLDKKTTQVLNVEYEIDHALIGRICERNIIIYPPGTLVVMKGERFTKDKLEYIEKIKKMGGEVIEC